MGGSLTVIIVHLGVRRFVKEESDRTCLSRMTGQSRPVQVYGCQVVLATRYIGV